jgi:hypothetical protein
MDTFHEQHSKLVKYGQFFAPSSISFSQGDDSHRRWNDVQSKDREGRAQGTCEAEEEPWNRSRMIVVSAETRLSARPDARGRHAGCRVERVPRLMIKLFLQAQFDVMDEKFSPYLKLGH